MAETVERVGVDLWAESVSSLQGEKDKGVRKEVSEAKGERVLSGRASV